MIPRAPFLTRLRRTGAPVAPALLAAAVACAVAGAPAPSAPTRWIAPEAIPCAQATATAAAACPAGAAPSPSCAAAATAAALACAPRRGA